MEEEKALKIFKTIAELGYDGIEIPLNNPNLIDPFLARKLAKEFELNITTSVALPQNINFMSDDESERDKAKEFLTNCVDLCNTMGSAVLGGVLYAPWGRTDVDKSEKKIGFLVEGLREISKYAEERGINLYLEPVNRFETNVLNTVKEGIDLIEKINSNNVSLLLDTFHMNIEEKDLSTAITEAGNLVGHFHTCENDRGIPGTGHIPWKDIVQSLKKINYDGFLVFEAFSVKKEEILNSANIWRSQELIPNPDKAAYESISFFKSIIY
ncbi:sugar phosphate isomerase/epimerase family protein [Mesoaciditoga lauensis]|uniref:sugar phosphate isomerase/epimerase family protein n=1 Tax=Mesoaciditoga lauensis TaxID=1495039 RepID=UPI0014778733|nr:sugar phosphate isomerase/epimerase family protein [Mesoaciditoga lauensis]